MTSRRVFIKQGAFALVSLGFAPSFLARTAMAAGGRGKQLIAIFQRGAVDGLNMVVPYGEGEYYKVRPSIAIARPGAGPDGALVNRMNVAQALGTGQLAGTTVNTAETHTTLEALLPGLSDTTRATMARATNEAERLALTLGSPEFQRR